MLTTSNARVGGTRAAAARTRDERVGERPRTSSVLAPAEEYLEVGFNYRMTDLQAAIGLVQLAKLPKIVARRRELAAGYAAALADVDGAAAGRRPAVGHRATSSPSGWRCCPARRTGREGLLEALADAGHLRPARHHGRPPATRVPRPGHRRSCRCRSPSGSRTTR